MSKLVFEPRLALVLKSKPSSSLAIAHDQEPIVVLQVLFDFVPYLARCLFRYDKPCRIKTIPITRSHSFKRRKEPVVILSLRRMQITQSCR